MKERCPYLKATLAGDEVGYWCREFDHPCGVEYNEDTCEEYEDFLREQEDEANRE